MENPEWYKDGCPESCNNTIAALYSPNSAVPLPGTSLILAFLDCPTCREGTVIGAEFIMAMFNRYNTNKPLCFQHIDLMGKEKDKFYYYQIEPIEIRKNIERGYSALLNCLAVMVWILGLAWRSCSLIIIAKLLFYPDYMKI